MIRRIVSRTVLVMALVSAGPAAAIAGELTPTDANLVTALDLSDSIMRHEQWLQFSGMAGAIESEAFLETIAGGLWRRSPGAVAAGSVSSYLPGRAPARRK